MQVITAFVFILTILSTSQLALSCKGCVSLDEYNFGKIIPRFKAALVKFDVAFPFGDKHEVFAKLAEEISSNNDILVGQVDVKDYGDKENKDLAKKYGIATMEELPLIKLFVNGLTTSYDFSKEAEWNIDNIRNLIRDNTKIYIGLPGCLEKYDKLAMEFVSVSNKETKLKEAEKVVAAEKESDKLTADTYILFMKKIVTQGVAFVKQELTRLSKILKDGKVNEKKKTELSHRINILHSFSIISHKDEL